MGQQSARMGMGNQQMAQNTQNAQDYNQMIGGVASTGIGAYQQQQQDDRWDKYNRSRWGEDS